jgi:phage terminase small subunit
MTDKQKRFCEEYLIDCNGTQAAIRAGYSEQTAKQIASENLAKPDLQTYIAELMEDRRKATIASAEEVLEYLTSVVRGQSKSHYIVVEGQGEGVSVASVMEKPPAENDRLKAAELLGKRYAMFTQKVEMEVTPVVIDSYDDIED